YVLGGFAHDTNSAYVLPPGGSWQALPNLAVPVGDSAAATDAQGRIYAIGGYTCPIDDCPPPTTGQGYNPTNPRLGWQLVRAMSTPRTEFGAATAADGRIWVFGGENCCGTNASAEAYDPATDTWTPEGSIDGDRHGTGLAVAGDGNLYAPG